jgi:hypothetical protein
MASFASRSEIIHKGTGGSSGTPYRYHTHKFAKSMSGTVSNRGCSLWKVDGYRGQAGANPGSTTPNIPTRTTAGAIAQTDPSGGRSLYLTGFTLYTHVQGTYTLYDRLLTNSELSATNTGTQTVGGTLTRHTDGVGVEIWVEIYTQIGATPTTITASYTPAGGGGPNTTQAIEFGGTNDREANRIIKLPLASGDVGVEAVGSVTVLATTGTAGNFGVTLAYPHIRVPGNTFGMAHRSFSDFPGEPGDPWASRRKIEDGACLAWMTFGAQQSGELIADLFMVES